jgi:hypothetical protein
MITATGTSTTNNPFAEVLTQIDADRGSAATTAQIDAAAALRGLPGAIKVLGYEVSWQVRDVQISRDDLKAALDAAGFGAYLPKRPPTARKALRRAINEWASTRAGVDFADDGEAGETTQRRRLIREIPGAKAQPGEATPVIFGLVEESSLGDQLGLRYATSYRFRYRPASADEKGTTLAGTLTVVSSATGPIADEERSAVADELRPIWEKHKQLYSGSDVGYLLIDIIHGLTGISVEAGSGVWFVPAKWAAAVDRVEALVRALPARKGGRGTHCRVRENIDWQRTRDALADAALDDLLAELREAERQIGVREAATKDKPGSVKITTVKGILDQLTGLREKAIFYADTMGLRQQRIVDDLDKLGTRAVVVARKNRDARKARDLAAIAPAVGLVAAPAIAPALAGDVTALICWLYDVPYVADAASAIPSVDDGPRGQRRDDGVVVLVPENTAPRARRA